MSLEDCCRLCLKNLSDVQLDEDGYLSIAENRNLQRMILECFQILVADGEIVSKVCGKCNDEIRFVDKIRKRVRRADFEIKQYYASLVVKQEVEFFEEAPNSTRIDTSEEIEVSQIENEEFDQKPCTSTNFEEEYTVDNDKIVNKYEFIEVEPLFHHDGTSIEGKSTDSHSESEHAYNAAIKRRKKTVPKVARKVDCKCYICATEFDTTETLDNHLSSHVASSAQQCNLCQVPVTTVRSLNMHLRTIHFRKGKRIPCEECKKINTVREFSSNFKLQAHIKTVHEGIVEIQEKKFICTFCGKGFSRGTHLRMHENIHTKAILYKCKRCPFSATSRSGLLRHERIHTAEKPFMCDECDASFNQSNALHSHKASKHSNERPFSCEICGDGKRFKTKYTLQTHMRMHENTEASIVQGKHKTTAMGTKITIFERELKCSFCPAVYYKEKFLCRHIVEKHPLENVPMIPCNLCKEANKNVFFLTQNEKDRHIDNHEKLSKTPAKERVCADCGEVFQTSGSFQRHRQTHFNNDCKECGKSFATRRTLRLHLLTVHLKSRPYKCDKCDSAFGQLTSLNAHMKVHQKVKKS